MSAVNSEQCSVEVLYTTLYTKKVQEIMANITRNQFNMHYLRGNATPSGHGRNDQ